MYKSSKSKPLSPITRCYWIIHNSSSFLYVWSNTNMCLLNAFFSVSSLSMFHSVNFTLREKEINFQISENYDKLSNIHVCSINFFIVQFFKWSLWVSAPSVDVFVVWPLSVTASIDLLQQLKYGVWNDMRYVSDLVCLRILKILRPGNKESHCLKPESLTYFKVLSANHISVFIKSI